jgi:hypothetical protein
MKTPEEILNIIKHSIGTTKYTKHWLGYLMTDGIVALAEAADCFWLLDAIASYRHNKNLSKDFQSWKLKVDTENKTATLTGTNGNDKAIVSQDIEYTTFPLDEVDIWVEGGVMLLPAEH